MDYKVGARNLWNALIFECQKVEKVLQMETVFHP